LLRTASRTAKFAAAVSAALASLALAGPAFATPASGAGHQRSSPAAVLRLSQSVDDTAWARSAHGKLYVANTGGGTIDVVTGPLRPGTVFVAVTPCDADNAPATCPAKGFPPNYLGQLNPWTGHIQRVPVGGPVFGPQGMVFIAPHWNVTPG
jgi:hypothetical protein